MYKKLIKTNKKQQIIVDDIQEIQTVLNHYPFLKNSAQWGSKKGVLSSIVIIGILLIGGIFALYFWVLPWASEKIAQFIPISYEQKIGSQLEQQTRSESTVMDSASAFMQNFSDKIR